MTRTYSFYAIQPCGRTKWAILNPPQVQSVVSLPTSGPSLADLCAEIRAGQEAVIRMGHKYLQRRRHGDGECGRLRHRLSTGRLRIRSAREALTCGKCES